MHSPMVSHLNASESVRSRVDGWIVYFSYGDGPHVDQINPVDLGSDVQLWNAGVIGLDPSDAPLLDEAMQLSDQIYERTRSVVSEELSISYLLNTRTRVRASADVVYHYWPYLRGWDPPHAPTAWARRIPELLSETVDLPPAQRGATVYARAYRLPCWGRRGRLYWRMRPLLERIGILDADVRRST